MAARRAGRFLAPLALLVTALAIGLVIKDHVGGKGSPGATTSAITSSGGGLSQGPRLPTKKKTAPKFYTVKSGNTLSGIAAQTGVPVTTIENLNPGLNPSALQTGQRLRLRR